MPSQMLLWIDESTSLPQIPSQILEYANNLQTLTQTLTAPPVVMRPHVVRGTCQFCGCHGNSCLDRTGERCDWLDGDHTCCNAEPCRARLAAAAAVPSTAKPLAQKKPAKAALKKRRYAGSRVDRAWNRYLSS